MEFPAQLRSKINALVEGEDIKELSKAAESLSERYRDERGNGKRSASGRLDVIAYSAVRMPATFAAVSRALELSLECFGGEIRSILDVGAGTGAGAIAAAMLTGCAKITCIERERAMADLGGSFFDCMGVRGEWIRRDIAQGIPEKADLVICSYCLNELPAAQRKAAVGQLADAAEKLLLIVEPGTPNSFSNVRQMRKQLIGLGLKIAAPCPNTGECPLPENDWCHFTARAARSRIHKQLKGADVPYEDEKFCFLAAAQESALPCEKRILRRPFAEKGKITLTVCAENGVSTELITKKNPLFKAARKASTGDKI
ncbi:MAG: small ribosomal subunit Rsm22 family protein [Lachnospiraceae bacterium]|nr:small ribosomal subunit Rsm22 family protein [Ruminococcus sp.]MCM1276152.1 small ribosomal subunit Rsm22 family protein [Lachnospiraceae bacterium]